MNDSGHDFAWIPLHPPSVPFRRVGDDDEERQADDMADRAMQMPDIAADCSASPRDRSDPNLPVTPLPSIVKRAVAGPARPLDHTTRAVMENGFKHDFSLVRIHTDDDAARAARLVAANAFAAGPHIVFGTGQFAPTGEAGRRLLAHELAHVVQQSKRVGRSVPVVQRKDAGPAAVWLPELGEILPRHVGPLVRMIQELTLVDIFGERQLEQHVRAIHANAEARKFTQDHGVAGVVALYDTSRQRQLDVAAAQQALSQFPKRYSRSSLEHLTLKPLPEAPRSFWFEDPTAQRQAAPVEGELPRPSSEERKVVFVEPTLSTARAKSSVVFVRFAYPAPHAGTERIKTAKNSILNAISHVMADLTGLPPAASREERREQLSVRARLGEAWRGFGAKRPLMVYIASDPRQEIATGQVAPTTERIYVRLEDVGSEARLQAAIRIPLIMVRGGVLPTPGGVRDIPAATPLELQRAMLHEALHVLLVRQSDDAESVWRANMGRLTVHGNPYFTSRFEELVRKYLIAQEEVFAYENEANLYPPVSPKKLEYDVFIKGVTRFLDKRGLRLDALSRTIPVHQRVVRQAVTWAVAYKVPSGAIELKVADLEAIDLISSVYPLQ